MRSVVATSCLLVFMVFTASVAENQVEPEATTGDPERGYEQYVAFGCYSCHGYTGVTGQTGVLLAPSRFPLPVFINYVRNPPRLSDYVFAMPAYIGEEVTDEVLTNIYVYLQTRPANTPPVAEIELLKDD